MNDSALNQSVEGLNQSDVVVYREVADMANSEGIMGMVTAVGAYPDAVFVFQGFKNLASIAGGGQQKGHRIRGRTQVHLEGQVSDTRTEILSKSSAALLLGNSATAPRDLICEADARAALLSLAESVGARLRLEGYQCRTVELSVRTADLYWCSHRMALRHPSDLTSELLDAALALCEQAHLWPDPLRSIGIRALELEPACAPHQLDLFEDAEHRARQRQLDITLDNLRARYGKTCVLRGRACFDPAFGLVQREEHAFLRK